MIYQRPRGATDNASDYESEDCRFESCRGRKTFLINFAAIPCISLTCPIPNRKHSSQRLDMLFYFRHSALLEFRLEMGGMQTFYGSRGKASHLGESEIASSKAVFGQNGIFIQSDAAGRPSSTGLGSRVVPRLRARGSHAT